MTSNKKVKRLGCLGAILRLLDPVRPAPTGLPYRRKDYFFSKAERSFYGVLCKAAGDQYVIFAKVRLGDLLWLPAGADQRQAHWNRIQSKHVDFVLCNHGRIQPCLVIELDDRTHQRAARQGRDAFVDRALACAGLPVIHVPVRHTYVVADLAAQIDQALNEANTHSAESAG